MRVGILTCRWGRKDVFEKFARGLRRLQERFDVIPMIVGEDKSFCEGFYFAEFPNRPLGRKHNAGMQAFKKLNPDYVMVLGSDDFMTNETMQFILDKCKGGYDVIGMRDCYFYDAPTGRLGYWKGFTAAHRVGESMGMCRTLSKRVIERLNWQPWHGKSDAGLDWLMSVKLRKIQHTQHVFSLREQGLFAVDYKTRSNICKFDQYETELVDTNLLKQIPEL